MRKIILAVLLVLAIVPEIQAAAPKPPIYTISHPRVVLHQKKRLVQIKWYHYGEFLPNTVLGVKLTNFRYPALQPCADTWDRYGYTYCYVIYQKLISTDGYITIADRKWRRGDQYWVARYDNPDDINSPMIGSYGPFIPK